METNAELPPRPRANKGSFLRLQPSPPTQESWQTLVKLPKFVELGIILLCVVSLPFSIITSLKYHYFAGGIVSAILTILISCLSLWLYTRSGLSCTTTLIRSVVFLIGWLITNASARWSNVSYDENDNTISYSSDWSTIVRGVVYWALDVLFLVYLILSAVAVHRDRNRRRTEHYRMHAPVGGAQYAYGPGPYGPPPPGYAPTGYAPAGAPPAGHYQPPPGPPPDRLA